MNLVGLLGTDSDSDGYVNISPMLFQNLIFEYVIQQDLCPIPRNILNYVCSKIKTKIKNSIKITYNELHDLLNNSDYEDSLKFKESLEKLKVFSSGYLQIGICSDTFDDFDKYFKLPEMNDERLMNFWRSCRNDVSGNTFNGDSLLLAKFKNACIFLNIDYIKAYSNWKDTLSHELTHFVHRVISFNNVNTFSKIEKMNMLDSDTGLQFLSADIQVNSNFYKMFDELFEGTEMKCSYLASLYKNTLYFREEYTIIQNILNGFQQMYEQQNVKGSKPVYSKLEINHNVKKYENQRINWLNNTLNIINKNDYFKTRGRWIVDEFMSSPRQKLTSPCKYQQKFKNAIVILQYVGVKKLISEYEIDDRLIEHFKSFKFRDN